MSKIQNIYIYLIDFADILSVLFNYGLSLFSGADRTETTIHGISDHLEQIEIGIDRDTYISFIPCTYHGKYLQPGIFKLQNSGNIQLSKIFRNLKIYIKKHCRVSDDGSYYIGSSMYQDWLSGCYILPVLFSYKKVSVEMNHVSTVLSVAIKSGLSIHNNNARLSKMYTFDFPCDSFVIFANKNNLHYAINKRTSFNYLYGSECIFVYQSNKIHGYDFLLDSRITEEHAPELCAFFNKIESNSDNLMSL